MDDATRQELLGQVNPMVLEALKAYEVYVTEVTNDAFAAGEWPDIQPWNSYLSDYLLAELEALTGGY